MAEFSGQRPPPPAPVSTKSARRSHADALNNRNASVGHLPRDQLPHCMPPRRNKIHTASGWPTTQRLLVFTFASAATWQAVTAAGGYTASGDVDYVSRLVSKIRRRRSSPLSRWMALWYNANSEHAVKVKSGDYAPA